jgi:hypothetical protein
MLRKSLNFINTLEEKASLLHNLAIVLYFELKTHNKTLAILKKGREHVEKNKNNFFAKRDDILDSLIDPVDEKDRVKRRLHKDEQILLDKEIKELNEMKLSQNENQDKFLKKEVQGYAQEFRNKEKFFLEASKIMSKRNVKEIPEVSVLEESLRLSKIPKNEKVETIMYGLENYDVEAEEIKILENRIDYENDLDSILPNLYIAIRFREMNIDLEDDDFMEKMFNPVKNFHNENDGDKNKKMEMEKVSYLRENYSKEMELFNFALLYKPFFDYYTHKINFQLRRKKSLLFFIKNEEEFIISIEKYKNTNLEILDYKKIENFKEISEKDKYFTVIKNRFNLPTCIFLAELFAENSNSFSEESEFWIKYALTLSTTLDDRTFILRSLVLTAAHLIDKSGQGASLTNAEIILSYLYDQFEKDKDNLEMKKELPTYAMAIHLLGVVTKADPKKKGEGLALIELAKDIRKASAEEERKFYLDFDRDFNFEMDYDDETIEYIDKNSSKNILNDNTGYSSSDNIIN